MDRFVGLEACLALRAQGKLAGPIVLVSCGTATTIDFIDEAGLHHGGLIGAGVDLGLSALHNGTAALPRLDGAPTKIERWNDIPGDTNSAMTSAALRMQAAWVEREVLEWSKHLGVEIQHCRLVMTGGRCDDVLALLSDPCQSIAHREPAVTLLGIAVLALNGA
jgi:type III pantothenate kinase